MQAQPVPSLRSGAVSEDAVVGERDQGRVPVLPLREQLRAARGAAHQHRRHLRLRDRLLLRQPLGGGRRQVQRPLARLLLISTQGRQLPFHYTSQSNRSSIYAT